MFRLLPREERYFDLFNRMASHLTSSALLLQQLFADFDRRAEYVDQIKQVEHTCDEITHDIVRRLNQTFITPIDREDIHALASALDDIVDYIDVHGPPDGALPPRAADRARAPNRSTSSCRLAVALERAVISLGKGDGRVLQECVAIHTLEHEGDTLHHDGRRATLRRGARPDRG